MNRYRIISRRVIFITHHSRTTYQNVSRYRTHTRVTVNQNSSRQKRRYRNPGKNQYSGIGHRDNREWLPPESHRSGCGDDPHPHRRCATCCDARVTVRLLVVSRPHPGWHSAHCGRGAIALHGIQCSQHDVSRLATALGMVPSSGAALERGPALRRDVVRVRAQPWTCCRRNAGFTNEKRGRAVPTGRPARFSARGRRLRRRGVRRRWSERRRHER